MQIRFGINITTFNRPSYVVPMLESFKKTIFLSNTIVKITDDASTDPQVKNYIYSYNIENQNVILKKTFNTRNLGSKANYWQSLLSFTEEKVDFIINLDSDCLLNKNWLTETEKIIKKFGEDVLCSSFFCRNHIGNPKNKLLLLEENYYERDTLNGLGICFPKKVLFEFNKQSHHHFDSYLNFDIKTKHKLRCICTAQSFIQHIGMHGEHSNPHAFDAADNFVGE